MVKCPKCGRKLRLRSDVMFSRPFGLTRSEFKICVKEHKRYDCKFCQLAWLFFPSHSYYWNQTKLDDGWHKSSYIYLSITEKVIFT